MFVAFFGLMLGGVVDVVFLYTHPGGRDSARTRSWGEINYSLPLARKYVANAGRFVVVTSFGVPSVREPYAEYVDRNTFLPVEFHATTNSITIQWYFPELRERLGLTNPFLVVEDDVFLARPIRGEDVRPCGDVHFGLKTRSTLRLDPTVRATSRTVGVLEDTLGFGASYQPAHAPYLVDVERVRWLWGVLDVGSSLTLERSERNLNFVFANAVAAEKGPLRPCKESDVQFVRMGIPLWKFKNDLSAVLKNFRGWAICVNDEVDVFSARFYYDSYREVLHSFLESLF